MAYRWEFKVGDILKNSEGTKLVVLAVLPSKRYSVVFTKVSKKDAAYYGWYYGEIKSILHLDKTSIVRFRLTCRDGTLHVL